MKNMNEIMKDAGIEAAIRAAFASGEFARAQKLWSEWASQVEAAIRGRTASPATLAEMRGLIDWARLVTLSFRARGAGRLAALHAASVYSGSPAKPAASLRASL